MKVHCILGADLCKGSIDLVSLPQKHYLQIENAPKGFKHLLTWMKAHHLQPHSMVVVMEHTGLYSYCFEAFLHQHHIPFAKVPALAITRSLGIIRGKTDKVDAARIARYGLEKQHSLQLAPPPNLHLQRLQMLYATRARLVRQRTALINSLHQYQQIGLAKSDVIIQSQNQVIIALNLQMKKLNQTIDTLIKEEPCLHTNFCLLTSIKGVGKVVATAFLVKTANFTRFPSPKKFCCFAGIAPFEHSSGSSIKGKTRVSHLADKEMKTLLHLAAQAAINHDQEIKNFYLNRVQSGKSKMSTINIVRNKLVKRAFAVIKRQSPYIENYQKAA